MAASDMLLFTFTCLGLVIFSGLFSMIEIAIYTAPLSKIQAESDSGNPSANILMVLKEKLDDAIASIVIMNNIVNIGGSFVMGVLTHSMLSGHPILEKIIPALIVVLIIIFGEVLPKNIGETYNMSIALYSAKFISLLCWVLALPIKLLGLLTKVIRNSDAPVTSEDEIKDLVNLGNKSGAIEDYEGEIIQKIFNLNDITAKSIMTHRVHLSALDEDTKILDITAKDLADLHSRIVIYDKDLDHITGLVLQKDILLAHANDKEILTLKEISHPHHTVYENVTAQRLLELFKKTRQHLFVVIDEEGGTNGVVTLEDVLEEIVGEIQDETDDENEEVQKEEQKENRIADMNVLGLHEEESLSELTDDRTDNDNDLNGINSSDQENEDKENAKNNVMSES